MAWALRLLVLVAVVATWALLLRPAVFGGPLSLVIVSGQSMEPTMHTGDLAVVFAHDGYEVGDVVAFRPPAEDAASGGGMVIHRIVDGSSATGFTMQGDGNDWLDPWQTPPDRIVGRLAFSIPDVGHVLSRLSDPVILGGLFAAVTAFLVVSGSEPTKRDPTGKTRTSQTAGATP